MAIKITNKTQFINDRENGVFVGQEIPELGNMLPAGYYRYDQRGGSTVMFNKAEYIKDAVTVMDENQKQVCEEFDLFWQAHETYKQMGTPHRRGYLLFGPAGTGKSTALRIVIQKTIEAGGVALEYRGDTNEVPGAVAMARFNRPPNSPVVVIMEDLERHVERGDQELTNMMDGFCEVNGVMFVATTNYIDKIPARLRDRPGRFDVCLLIDFMNDAVRIEYVKYLLRDVHHTGDDVAAIVHHTPNMTVAQIREVVNRVIVFKQRAAKAAAEYTDEGKAIRKEQEQRAKAEPEEMNSNKIARLVSHDVMAAMLGGRRGG